jgi:hypothetical protein
MDWIKQNKFLAAFLLIILVAGGGLGFLAFSAKGRYDEVRETYTTKSTELNRLQTSQPYPEQDNVKKMQEVQKAHQAAIDALHKDLIKAQVPLKPLTPEKFQDNLREAVRRVAARAASRNVNLGDSNKPESGSFYMGFANYQGVPPKVEAAAPLGRMLEAMEIAINALIDSGITTLKEIKRESLPEEGGATGTTSGASSKPGLVERHSFEVHFEAPEPQFRRFLNDLISSKQQFFIPSSIVVANSMDKGPSKSETASLDAEANVAAAAPAAQPPAAGATSRPSAAPAKALRKVVVGDEKLDVTARIEVVNFAEPK